MSKTTSKQVLVRMSPALHEHLVAQAKAQGVSLNHWITELLAGGSSFKLK